MTIYHIEAFLTIAETLNFTKASEHLHTTQPNLSRMIANIEQEVGVKLLDRNKRDVKLTPAGEVFSAEVKKSLEQYKNAITRAHEVDAGIRGTLDVAFLGTALSWVLPGMVHRFRERFPDIRLNLLDYTYSNLVDAIREHKSDIALAPEREIERIPGLERRFLFSDDMCLIVSSLHPLAGRNSVELSEVRDEPFIMMDPKISIRDYEMVSDMCTENGFEPNVAYKANTLNNLMLMVECNEGVSVLASHMTHYSSENVHFLRIKGYESYFRVTCAWRENVNPCIASFLEVLEEFTSDEIHP